MSHDHDLMLETYCKNKNVFHFMVFVILHVSMSSIMPTETAFSFHSVFYLSASRIMHFTRRLPISHRVLVVDSLTVQQQIAMI